MSAGYAGRNLAITPAQDVDVLPFRLRVLVVVSTAGLRPPGWLDPAIRTRLAALAAAGWTIRLATPRNYMLWWLGRTLNRTRLPLLVLPLDYGRLDALARNVFVASEILRAEARIVGREGPVDPALYPDFEHLVGVRAAAGGVAVRDAAAIYARAWREIERTLGAD